MVYLDDASPAQTPKNKIIVYSSLFLSLSSPPLFACSNLTYHTKGDHSIRTLLFFFSLSARHFTSATNSVFAKLSTHICNSLYISRTLALSLSRLLSARQRTLYVHSTSRVNGAFKAVARIVRTVRTYHVRKSVSRTYVPQLE